MSRLGAIVGLAALLAVTTLSPRAVAQDGRAPGWPEVKCARYAKAWADALARRGTRGLGIEFLDRHEAFLASGCTARSEVCPRSAEELELANVMIVAGDECGYREHFPPVRLPR